MNPTHINSELLSAEARGRKHIPFAVFAVILIHVMLFLVLLIAAGCRAKARAKRNMPNGAEIAQASPALMPSTNTPPQDLSPQTESVLATEPPIERATPQPARRTASPAPRPVPAASPIQTSKMYVVQPGDTVGKIAQIHGTTVKTIREENKLKNDMIRPGQKLRVNKNKSLALR